jgi:uncharacterized membrane protein (UPF0127 family)
VGGMGRNSPEARGNMLHVVNETRGTTLIERGRVANNAWTRFKGLIGVRELPQGDGLAIIPCNGVHCMFMSIPIDVVYVDRDHRITAFDPVMKPWAVGRVHRDAQYVIELPAGTIERTGTQVGDQLSVSY